MDGNKLKHKFVKKEKSLEENDWIRSAARYTNAHRNRRTYPMGVIDGVNINYEQPPARFEVSTVEEVSVERVITMNALNTYDDRSEELKETIKADMVKELAQHLLENGFVESFEVIVPSDFSTKIIMKIKAKKII